jgi:hypothetical protein
MTGARQTMGTWARVIEAPGGIPEVFQAACQAVLGGREPFPYLVLVPALLGTRHAATEKLLCELDGVFYIWEHTGRQVTTTAYPLQNICMLETGMVLLYSWLTVSGVNSQGAATSTVIPYNTATGRHLAPFIDKMRPAPKPVEPKARQAELAKLSSLMQADFKFMNYARESLLPGAQALQAVWQPLIRQNSFEVDGKAFSRMVTLAHLALLTDQEVILIEDDEYSSETRGVRYGGIWQYIPRRQITAVSLTEPANELVTLSLTLACGQRRLDRIFTAANLPALEAFRQALGRG